MSDNRQIALGYTLAPNFSGAIHTNLELVHIGLENKFFDAIRTYITARTPFRILRTNLTRIPEGTDVYDWVDVELVAPIGAMADFDSIDYLDMLLDNEIGAKGPYRLASLQFTRNAIEFPIATTTHNAGRFNEIPAPITQEYSFIGFMPTEDTVGTKLHTITLHTSKEVPVVHSLYDMEMLKPRTASMLYLTPYFNEGGYLQGYLMGHNGKELVERAWSRDAQINVLPVPAMQIYSALTTEEQFHVNVVVNAYIGLYGSISAAKLSNMIYTWVLFEPICHMVLTSPAPSRDHLQGAFESIYALGNDLPF